MVGERDERGERTMLRESGTGGEEERKREGGSASFASEEGRHVSLGAEGGFRCSTVQYMRQQPTPSDCKLLFM